MTEAHPTTPRADPAIAAAALRLATAYQSSRALHVAVRLGPPDLLSERSRSADELAAATALHAPSLMRLLRALVAFDVFAEEPVNGRFTLRPLGALLRAGAPGSLRDPVLMFGHEDFWLTWGELENCVRSGETAAKLLFGDDNTFARYVADSDLGSVFNAAMTALSTADAAAAVASYDFSRYSKVVDVGGGHGRLLAEILRTNPHVHGVLIDLPPVADRAALILTESDVGDRCEIVGGDMFSGVPEGGDLYILKAVLHDWDDARAISILANCRAAMGELASPISRPGATVVFEEWWRLDSAGLHAVKRKPKDGEIVLDPPQTLLALPLAPRAWEYAAADGSFTQTYRMWGPLPIDAPAGKELGYIVVATQTIGSVALTAERHFLPGVGMVREVIIQARHGNLLSRQEMILTGFDG